MTAPMTLVHVGCGTGHITVGGADDDLRNALAMALDGVTEGALEPYTGASRAGVSLKTQDKSGLRHLRLATDGPGPGERQKWRGGEPTGWGVGLCTCRDASAKKVKAQCCLRLLLKTLGEKAYIL